MDRISACRPFRRSRVRLRRSDPASAPAAGSARKRARKPGARGCFRVTLPSNGSRGHTAQTAGRGPRGGGQRGGACRLLAAGAPIRVAIFDDRLEVENPGLLPFGLTLASEDRAEAPLPDGGHAAGLGTRDIAAAIGLSPRATRMRLARLAARGLARELGTGPHDPRRRYVTVR